MRLTMNPGRSLLSTLGSLPQRLRELIAACMVAGDVCSPGTISRNRVAWAGSNQCIPKNRSGCRRPLLQLSDRYGGRIRCNRHGGADMLLDLVVHFLLGRHVLGDAFDDEITLRPIVESFGLLVPILPVVEQALVEAGMLDHFLKPAGNVVARAVVRLRRAPKADHAEPVTQKAGGDPAAQEPQADDGDRRVGICRFRRGSSLVAFVVQDHFNFDGRAERKLAKSERRAGVPAGVAKHFEHQLGCSVHHDVLVGEVGVRIHVAGNSHDARDVVERSDQAADGAKHIRGTQRGRLLRIVD